MSAGDEQFMQLALRLSKRNLGQCWPNPSVGAVVVSGGGDGVIVGLGCTQRGGRPHGERMALDMAGDRARGGTLYVTLEPCAHHGRTPPCTDAIAEAGVARVVYGLSDVDPRVKGRGLAQLREAGIALDQASDAMRARIALGLRGHFKRVVTGRPFVQLKLAVGSDGLMKPGDGRPQWVTGEMARARGHLARARADAILVGKGTVLADNPSLTCRLPGLESRSPVRVVVDSMLAMPLECALLASAEDTPLWVYCRADAPGARKVAFQDRGAEVDSASYDPVSGRLVIQSVLDALGERGITRLLVEGGPTVARSLLENNLADEIIVFAGAQPAGEGGIDPLGGLGLDWIGTQDDFFKTFERPLGADNFTIYRRKII